MELEAEATSLYFYSPAEGAHKIPQLLQVLQLLPHLVHLRPALWWKVFKGCDGT